VLERRGELAVMQAVGFSRAKVRGLVLREHVTLLWAGLGLGIVAALIAVVPALRPGSGMPWSTLGLTLLAIVANGFLWTWLATRFAMRGQLLEALRNQ
jgi:ABC-type antimicrobial peptide transport system permease subunit